jgi:hypothetical protein
MYDLWHTIKRTKLQILGKEGEKIQAKVIENIFNKIIVENFPNLESSRYRRSSEHQTGLYYNIDQRKNIRSCKREPTSHI